MSILCLALAFGLAVIASPGHSAPDVLVVMHNSGKVERYDGATGAHVGTFITGCPNGNGIAWGPDGNLYLSTGNVLGPGTVKRFDGTTGRFIDDFVAYPAEADGYLCRGSGLTFYEGRLYVSSIDNAKIICYDGATGAWVSDFAEGSKVGVTMIAFHDGALYGADFQTESIRKYDGVTGKPEGDLTSVPGVAPWGLAFDTQGNLYWSGNDHAIRRFDGRTNVTWAGGKGVLDTPVWIALGPDGDLYCSSYGSNTVTVWSTESPAQGRLLRTIEGPEVTGPAGLAFTDRRRVVRESMKLESTGKQSRVRLEADAAVAELPALGWDTEGGDRSRLNLLLSPVHVRVKSAGRWQSLQTRAERPRGQALRYRLALAPGAALTWTVRARGGGFSMDISGEGKGLAQIEELQLVFPFDPRVAATTVLTGDWTDSGRARLPFVISAPDLGQMYVTCPQHPELEARLDGDRVGQTVTLTFLVPTPSVEQGTTLDFRPLVLPLPPGLKDRSRWAMGRRGWFNFLELSSQWGTPGTPGSAPAGIWANNVVSDPVSSTVFWLGDHALLVPELAPGISVPQIVRRSVDYWLDQGRTPEGEFYYVVHSTTGMMDSHPSILIAAWSYVAATGDLDWLRRRIEQLESVAAYDEARDVDHDGLIESKQSGNRGAHTFGDTAWDTYSSGHKNAYVNLLAYRAFRCLADLEGRLNRPDRQAHYRDLADRLKAAFLPTFYNPESGWLGWWRSEDGMLHDVSSDVPTSLAIIYGLVDTERGREMLDRYWEKLQGTGFHRFDLGVPLNIFPVHRDDQFGEWGGKKEDGSDTFGKYLNGGCCVSNTVFFLVANYVVGRTDRADLILDAMLKRQQDGVFPNGGGFQNGVINRYPEGAEFYDWNGNTCGYEGHLVYSWAFLQALLLREPQFRERLYGVLGG